MLVSLRARIFVILLVLYQGLPFVQQQNNESSPVVNMAQYIRPYFAESDPSMTVGDINIGVLFSATSLIHTTSLKPCELCAAVKYAVDHLNRGHALPRNMTLGYVALDSTGSAGKAAVQGLSFLPRIACPGPLSDVPIGYTEIMTDSYDVVAVVQALEDSELVPLVYILGNAPIPQVNILSTADVISGGADFPNYFSLQPSVRYRTWALIETLKRSGWSYISIVRSVGHTENGDILHIKDQMEANSICAAAIVDISDNIFLIDVESITRQLMNDRRATVVLLLVDCLIGRAIIETAHRKMDGEPFIWFFWKNGNCYFPSEDVRISLEDSLVLAIPPNSDSDFSAWFDRPIPETMSPERDNACFNKYRCDLREGVDYEGLVLSALDVVRKDPVFTGYLLDSLAVIANATSRLLQDADCYNLTGPEARQCITGQRLHKEIQATRQRGFNGWLELDTNGQRFGEFLLYQFRVNSSKLLLKPVYRFYGQTGHVVEIDDLVWTRHLVENGKKHPLSLCSFPCPVQYIRVKKEVRCCWSCRRCAVNERLVNNYTQCEICPEFYWPDITYTSCLKIKQQVNLLYDKVLGKLQNIVAIFYLVVCLCVLIFFQVYRNMPIMLTCCRGLSFMMLLGIAMGYVTAILFTLEPSNTSCRFIYLFFTTSFSLIFGPLVVRALQCFIYAQQGITFSDTQKMSIWRQYAVALAIVFGEVIISVTILIWEPHWHGPFQSRRTVPYVVLTCRIPSSGIMATWIYTSGVVAKSALLTLMSRRYLEVTLIENDFLSVYVCSTFILLVCFSPAYIITTDPYFKMLILCQIMVLDDTIALTSLFLSKIYMVVNYRSFSDKRQTTSSTTTELSSKSQGSTLRGNNSQRLQ